MQSDLGRQRRWVHAVFVLFLLILLSALLQSLSEAGPDQPAGWEVAGQVGGPTQAVAVQGGYAYVGVGLRLVVLDVTDPAAPIEVGSTAPFPYFVEDITLSGTRAYVAAGGAGLRIVDLSDPAHPLEIGAWDSPGYAEAVAVSGGYAFLANGPYGLWVLDVSDPADPTPIGSAYDMNYAFDVAVSGDHAYIAAAGAGLLVADVSDPARPAEMGRLDTPGYAYGVAVSGTTAYVADGWGGLRIVEFSQPGDPGEVGACDTPGWALDVVVETGVAYVAGGAGGLRLVDVSDPADPAEIGTLEVGALARRLAVGEGMVYVADLTDGLLQIDATHPQQPAEVSRYSPFVEARYVAVGAGNATLSRPRPYYAYVAAGFSGLRVVDVSDPARPRQVAAYDTEDAYATGVVISGAVAYVPTYLSGASPHDLHIVDISDPLHPTRLATVDTDGVFREVAVQGGILYAADEHGLRVIDVTDPSAPVEIGFTLIGGEQDQASDGVVVAGSWAYVAVAEWGLYIFDITTPAEPRLVGVYDPPGGVTSIAVAAGRAYLSSCFDGLRVVDVSDPSAPHEIGHLDTPGYGTAVALSGGRAYVSDGGGGLQVVDISDPTAPALVDSVDTKGFAWHAALADGHLYVADSQGGLVILVGATHLTSALHLSPLEVAGPSGSFPFTAPSPLAGHAATATATDAAANTSPFSQPAILWSETHTVTSALDSGPGTLRQALLSARTGDAITFDAAVFDPAHPATIALLTDLPTLDQGQVTIDASQAGVILDGQLIEDSFCGLPIASDANTVRGLQFVGFDNTALCVDGRHNTVGGDRAQGSGPTGQGNQFGANYIAVAIGGDENAFLGNLVGVDASGSRAMGNTVGVGVGGAGNHIGGPTPGQRNIVSANSFRGIFILGERARFNVVAGNYVGADITGRHSLPNLNGVSMEITASNNTIGGTSPAERNLISGNAEKGVLLSDAGSHNAVIGNWIGVDASGRNALGNTHGIFIGGVSFNRIGGTAPGEANVISGNGAAIDVATPGYTDNLILGNLIGVTPDGSRPLGNGIGIGLHVNTRRLFIGGATPAEGNVIAGNHIGVQIRVAGTEHNWIVGNAIGGDATGALRLGNSEVGVLIEDSAAHTLVQGNAIAYNGTGDAPRQAGVFIAQSSQNTIRRNAIHGNARQGIALIDGGNHLLPAPVILTATEATLSGMACPGCTVEIYSDAEDEGRVYEGMVVADAAGHFAFDKGSPLSGPHVTATATDREGNTSAFSAPVARPVQVYLPLVLKGHGGDAGR